VSKQKNQLTQSLSMKNIAEDTNFSYFPKNINNLGVKLTKGSKEAS